MNATQSISNSETSELLSTSGPPKPWASSAEEVARELQTSMTAGLEASEAETRLRTFGPNQLRQVRRRSAWRILWDQFASPLAALLIAAAVAAFVFDETLEGSAVVVVLLLNAAIGFLTEQRAVRSMEALRELGVSEATVRRGGSTIRIASQRLVPGDLVVLDAGDISSADLRLISASRLQADESLLTGESLPVEKHVEAVGAEAALAERSCMLFKGTAITRGSGEGVVVATGMSTELGHISALVQEAEGEATPLEKRLDRLARKLIGLTLAVAVLIAITAVLTGRDLFMAVETAIALAVATIPEGLPIVATVALARGMWRMARRHALIENLAAVETLGSTTIIMTDKTGTLTENRMTAVEYRLPGGPVLVEGTGLAMTGGFRRQAQPLVAAECPELLEALRAGVLCNNAALEGQASGEVRAVGDPTEVALLVAGAKAGLEREELLRNCPEVAEVAFDSETKRMATLHRIDGALVAAVKGAPEAIVECCSTIRAADGLQPLAARGHEEWLQWANEMASRGERVLAVARADVADADDFRFEGLELLGLVGIFDPPRESVRAAVEACRGAGIRVVMVTGDHGATAWNVAGAVGIVDAERDAQALLVDARTLSPLGELSEVAIEQLRAAAVIARATPRQKLDWIEMHQRAGEVVAMTGDGVNDAPALKKADIGIAMGVRGTQVAREAADRVLQDDELGTMVMAIGQGRAIYANIRKFVVYLLSCNVSEIFVVGLGALSSGPLLILPMQILFLNFVTDVFPALALGVCEGSPALLHDRPRDPNEAMLLRRHWRSIFLTGAVMALSVLAALLLSTSWLHLSEPQSTSVAFLTLAMAQLWHVFTMRNRGSGWIRNEITSNLWIWGALCLCLGLLWLAVYWSPLAEILSITAPGASGWGLVIGCSLIPLVIGQLTLVRRFQRDR